MSHTERRGACAAAQLGGKHSSACTQSVLLYSSGTFVKCVPVRLAAYNEACYTPQREVQHAALKCR